MINVVFDSPTGQIADSTALSSSGSQFVTVPGKLFHIGEYPAKDFTLTEAEAAAEVSRFNALGKPAPMNYEHKPGILDGHLGSIQRLWTQGKEIWADFAVPTWFAQTAKAKNVPLKVSAEFEKNTKHLRAAAWVLNPHIKDAQLVAAFNASYPNGRDTRPQRIQDLLDDAKRRGGTVSTDDLMRLFSDDDAKIEKLESENKSMKQSRWETEATIFVDDVIQVKKRVHPSERSVLMALFKQCAEDDDIAPRGFVFDTETGKNGGGRVAMLKGAISLRHPLGNVSSSLDIPQNRIDELLAMTSQGRQVLAERAEQKAAEDG